MAARLFTLHLRDGQVCEGVVFSSGQVALNTPADLHGPFHIALTLDDLLTGRAPQDPLYGARVEGLADEITTGTPHPPHPTETP
jgi:hypothetical protein